MLMGTTRRSDELEQSLCETRSRKGTLLYVNELSVLCLSDLGVFLGVVGGIMTSILLTVQKSKCKKIKCCGCECDRDPTLATDKAKLAGKDVDDKP